MSENDDFEELQGDESARRLVEYHAREWGWEPTRSRSHGGSIFCDRNVRPFFEAANDLLELLKDGRIFADTDASIVDLTRMRDYPWWKFVDPALSRQRSGPHAGSVIVLWHCSDHIVSLHNKGRGQWKVYQGEDELLDLKRFLDEMDSDDDDLDSDLVPETSDRGFRDFRSEEDNELLSLKSQAIQDMLEQEDESDE